eukprot:IDg16624t1
MKYSLKEGVVEYKKRVWDGVDLHVRTRPTEKGTIPAPAALLFGWFGAKPRHVDKYAARWNAMGYSTALVVAPTSVVFAFGQRKAIAFLRSVLDAVAADKS